MDSGQVILNIDPHVHTEYSLDGSVSIKKVVDLCRQKGLNGVAITDHNRIEGALKLKESAPKDFFVIVGEEINSSEGEITGLFLKSWIPSGLSPEKTVEKIKSQGGLVSITHPFCRFRRNKLKFETLNRIIDMVDTIEVFNSRNVFNSDNQRAYAFATDHNKLKLVGSDAHIAHEYGKAYIKIPTFNGAGGFKKNLLDAAFVTRKSPLWVHLATKGSKWIRMIER